MRYSLSIGICWVLFWLYWIGSATKSKQNSKPYNSKEFFGLRLGIAALAAALALIFDRLPQSFREHALGTDDVAKVFGLALFLVGMALAVWARVDLGKNWGMPMTEKRQPELITSGPYSYIRHPIYTGILVMALGSAVDVNSYWLLVFIVAAIYFVYSAVKEEQNLSRQFGAAYERYKDKTKMLIPYLF